MDFTDSSDEDFLNLAVLYYIITKKKKVQRRYWVRKINKKREPHGEYHSLVVPDLEEDDERFYKYFRVTKAQFEKIHDFLKTDLRKIHTRLRKPIGTKERLAVCLRFLATGNSFQSLSFNYRMGSSTVRSIVKQVCEAIWKNMSPRVMPLPTISMWRKISEDFNSKWNFPNCIGALDGKHVNIQCPINAGSQFWNYKGQHSIVLLALVDADYKFIAVDVGAYGRNSDGGIFEKSALGKKLLQKELDVPEDQPLRNEGEAVPHVIVGDEAFPLLSYLMRPYSKNTLTRNEPNKIFNYRLSRARRISENAFASLRARWRVFQGPLQVQPNLVDKIILAACCLHNYLGPDFEIADDIETYFEPRKQAFVDLDRYIQQNPVLNAFHIRNQFRDHFNSPAGSVTWQLRMIRRGQRNINDNS